MTRASNAPSHPFAPGAMPAAARRPRITAGIALVVAAAAALFALAPSTANGASFLDKIMGDAAHDEVCTCAKNVCAAKVGPDVEGSPDLNTWMARVLSEGFEGSGFSDYANMTRRITEQRYPEYINLGESLLDNSPLLISSNLFLTLKNGTPLNKKAVYEAVLIDYLAFSVYDTEDSHPFDPSIYSGFLTDSFGIEADVFDILFPDADLPALDVANGLSQYLDQMQVLQENVLETTIKANIDVATARQAAEERIYLLKCVRDDILGSDSPDYDLVNAIDEIVSCYDRATDNLFDTDYFDTQAFDSALSIIWNETLNILSIDNPAFAGIKLAGTALDILFDNSERATSNQRLAMIYTVGHRVQSALANAHSIYLPHKGEGGETEKAAAKGFVSCYYGYIEYQLYATAQAMSWVNINASPNNEDARAAMDACNNDVSFYTTYLSNLAGKTATYMRLYTTDCTCGCQKTVPAKQRDATDGTAVDDAWGDDGDRDDVDDGTSPADTAPPTEPDAPDVPEIDYSIERHAGDEEDAVEPDAAPQAAEHARVAPIMDENGSYGYCMYDMYVYLLVDIATHDLTGFQGVPGQACYALYDIDGDGVYELFVNYGQGFATMEWHVYAISDDGLGVFEIGTFDGNRIELYARSGPGVWGVFDAQGYWGASVDASKDGLDLYVGYLDGDTGADDDARACGPIPASWFSEGGGDIDLWLFDELGLRCDDGDDVSDDDPDSSYCLRDADRNDAVRIRRIAGYDYFDTASREDRRYVYENSYEDGLGGIFFMLHWSEITEDEYFSAADELFMNPDDHSVTVHEGSVDGLPFVLHVVVDGTGDGYRTSYFAWLTDGVRKVSVEYYGPDDPDVADLMTEELFLEAVASVEFL